MADRWHSQESEVFEASIFFTVTYKHYYCIRSNQGAKMKLAISGLFLVCFFIPAHAEDGFKVKPSNSDTGMTTTKQDEAI